jgi:hypothetical protein
VFVRDTVLQRITYYVDGVQLGAVHNYPYNPTGGSNADVWIGAAQSGPDQWYFDGGIDEVRLSRGLRSPDWIKLEFETQKPGTQAVVGP